MSCGNTYSKMLSQAPYTHVGVFINFTHGFSQVCQFGNGLGTMTRLSLFQASVARKVGYASPDHFFRWRCLYFDFFLETSLSPDYAFSLGNVGGRVEDQMLVSPVGSFVLFLPIFQYSKYCKFSDVIHTAVLFCIMNANIATKKYGFRIQKNTLFQLNRMVLV